MNRYEDMRIAQALAFTTVGQLPQYGEKPPQVRLRVVKVKVLRDAFFYDGAVPKVGATLHMPIDEARGLEQRRLVELV